jgi:hypothetical protein
MSHLGGRLFVMLSACLGALAPASPAWPVETRREVFTVTDVAVDTTAATAAAAREQAIATGERLAFARLLARLTLKRDASLYPKVDSAALADLTEGFEVQEEKNSPVRYIAKLTYRFKQHAIEPLLRNAGVPFAETPSKPVLVLPLLRSGGNLALWEDPNPWRGAWANLPAADGLVPFIAPIGDLKDSADISADGAAKGDADKIAAIAARYGAGSALVATATLRTKDDGSPSTVDLAMSRFGTEGTEPVTASAVAAQSGETADALFTRAALEVEALVAERWKEDNLLHFDQAKEVVVTVPIASLEDWLKVRTRLAQVASVSRAQLVLLSRQKAQVDVRYLGDAAQLKLALAQHDLVLAEENGATVLRLAGAGAAAPAQAAPAQPAPTQ